MSTPKESTGVHAAAGKAASIFPHRMPCISHILAPTDLGPESRKAIKYAIWFARRYHARLTLLHVCESPGTFEFPDPGQIYSHEHRAEERLLKLYDVAKARHQNTSFLFRRGAPKTDIPAIAQSLSVDLIVISTHNYHWLWGMIEGSNTTGIIHHANCPVLVVQQHERDFIS